MAVGPILIVDDDPLLHEAIADALAFYGYQTRVAENGRAGLAAIDAERPAMVLLDLRMPSSAARGSCASSPRAGSSCLWCS